METGKTQNTVVHLPLPRVYLATRHRPIMRENLKLITRVDVRSPRKCNLFFKKYTNMRLAAAVATCIPGCRAEDDDNCIVCVKNCNCMPFWICVTSPREGFECMTVSMDISHELELKTVREELEKPLYAREHAHRPFIYSFTVTGRWANKYFIHDHNSVCDT